MTQAHHISRFPSGVPGLDTILQGGLFRGSIAIIRGSPGAGKTILANQIMFHAIGQGSRAAYISLLGESNSRLFAYLDSLSFFQRAPIADTLLYYNASHVVESNNLAELQEMARQAILGLQVQVLVIDGLSTMSALSESDIALKQFVRLLQAYCESQQCTALILQDDQNQEYGVDTTVDAILVLHNTQRAIGGQRELEIRKLRGSSYLEGRHQFRITQDGLHIYPRTEALVPHGLPPAASLERLSSGLPVLDAMLGGGYPHASLTSIFGTPGSGRTFIGQYFLAAGAARGEPGLLVGFNEPPDQLLLKADGIGLPFKDAVAAGTIDVLWRPAFENIADALVEQLLAAIEQRGVRRLVIDGLEGLQQPLTSLERQHSIFAALTVELRRRQVTTLFTLELQSLSSPSIEFPVQNISMLADNILFLRAVELHAQFQRLIAVQKMRRSHFDPMLRRFVITEQGILIDGPFGQAEGLLTGQPHPAAPPREQSDSPADPPQQTGERP